MKHNPRFEAVTDAAKQGIREIDAAAVVARRDAGVPPVLVDVREDREWDAGRIPGSVHIGRGVIERDVETRFPDVGAELVLVCGGGYRSALAAESLQRMGYTNVLSLAGGTRGWRAAALPWDGDAAPPDDGFTVG